MIPTLMLLLLTSVISTTNYVQALHKEARWLRKPYCQKIFSIPQTLRLKIVLRESWEKSTQEKTQSIIVSRPERMIESLGEEKRPSYQILATVVVLSFSILYGFHLFSLLLYRTRTRIWTPNISFKSNHSLFHHGFEVMAENPGLPQESHVEFLSLSRESD